MSDTVFAVKKDGYDYQELDLMLDDIIDERPGSLSEDDVMDFSTKNTQMSAWWPKPDTEFNAIDDEDSPTPDITTWIDASLVLSSKAFRLLGDTLKSWGEFLPVAVGGETFYIFNCLTMSKVDESQSKKKYFEGEEVGIESIVFDESDLGDKLIFKTSYNSCADLYCKTKLKNLIEDFGLSGVAFSDKLGATF